MDSMTNPLASVASSTVQDGDNIDNNSEGESDQEASSSNDDDDPEYSGINVNMSTRRILGQLSGKFSHMKILDNKHSIA